MRSSGHAFADSLHIAGIAQRQAANTDVDSVPALLPISGGQTTPHRSQFAGLRSCLLYRIGYDVVLGSFARRSEARPVSAMVTWLLSICLDAASLTSRNPNKPSAAPSVQSRGVKQRHSGVAFADEQRNFHYSRGMIACTPRSTKAMMRRYSSRDSSRISPNRVPRR